MIPPSDAGDGPQPTQEPEKDAAPLEQRVAWWQRYGEGVQAEPLIRDLLARVQELEDHTSRAMSATAKMATELTESQARVQELEREVAELKKGKR